MRELTIAIVGSPRAGKTTAAARLSEATGLPVVHSDDLVWMGWSEASAEIADRMQRGLPCIYEGVAVIRGLRKAMAATAALGVRPVDACIVLPEPRGPLLAGQEAMRKGCATMQIDMEPELQRRGTRVVYPRVGLDWHCGEHVQAVLAEIGAA